MRTTAVRKKVIGNAMTAELGKKDGTKAGSLVSKSLGDLEGQCGDRCGQLHPVGRRMRTAAVQRLPWQRWNGSGSSR